jgi:hypothetical protein
MQNWGKKKFVKLNMGEKKICEQIPFGKKKFVDDLTGEKFVQGLEIIIHNLGNIRNNTNHTVKILITIIIFIQLPYFKTLGYISQSI